MSRNHAVGCCLVEVGRAVPSATLREFGKCDGADPALNNSGLVPKMWIDRELRNNGLGTARPTVVTTSGRLRGWDSLGDASTGSA